MVALLLVLGTGLEPSIASLRGGLPDHLEEPSIKHILLLNAPSGLIVLLARYRGEFLSCSLLKACRENV